MCKYGSINIRQCNVLATKNVLVVAGAVHAIEII